jgi:hypothetical protein
MRRREFIAGLGSLAAWPLAARGQQPAIPVVGFLRPQSAGESEFLTVAFRQGLKETGYVDGQNVAVEYRWAENQYNRLPALAGDLVRRRVAVIVAPGTPEAQAAKAATTTIPIVFASAGDPVALGLVASLSRPGGNLTGHLGLTGELTPKRLQLLHELIPNAAAFGVLVDSVAPTAQSIIAAVSTSGAFYISRNLRAAALLDWHTVVRERRPAPNADVRGLVVHAKPRLLGHAGVVTIVGEHRAAVLATLEQFAEQMPHRRAPVALPVLVQSLLRSWSDRRTGHMSGYAVRPLDRLAMATIMRLLLNFGRRVWSDCPRKLRIARLQCGIFCCVTKSPQYRGSPS